MRRWYLGLFVAALAVGPAAADDKAEAVVKKGIEAHGGADALNKYKAGRFKMKGEMSIAEMDLEFTGTLAYALPDRYRLEVSAELMGQKLTIRQVVKGETVKSTIKLGDTALPGGGGAEKEELKLAAALQEAEQLTPLLDSKKFTLKAADDEDVDGKKAAVVLVTPKAVDKQVKFYFSKDSGLLVKTSHKGPNPMDPTKEVDEETYQKDFQKVKGVQVPMKLEVKHDGAKFLTIKVSDYELLEKLDDKEFAVDD